VQVILKQLRLSRCLSQEQLAQMSGLNVRTIQRIESGQNASLESLKCIASALEIDVSALNQEKFMINKHSDDWRNLPFQLKCWFFFDFLNMRPKRGVTKRIEIISHISGFLFCLLGLVFDAAQVGGLLMLTSAYLFTIMTWHGDKYGTWYEPNNAEST